MKIIVKVRHIELIVDDEDSDPVIKYESNNNQVIRTIKVMVEEAIKLLAKSN